MTLPRRPSLLPLVFSALLGACLVTPASAQSTFYRNDAYDFRPMHNFRVYTNLSGELATAISTDTDYRLFKLSVTGISNAVVIDHVMYYIQQLRFDMDNDGTWDATVTSNFSVVSFTYPEPAGLSGSQTIRVEAKLIPISGAIIYRTLYQPVTVFRAPRVYCDAASSANAIVQYRNRDCADKLPVLIVEGFDVGDRTGPDTYYTLSQDFIDADLIANGYEVFILNFNYANARLQDNAAVVLEALKKVHELCPNYQITLAGLSMGGLISRYALALAENQGTTHHVGLFVSYNSPQHWAHANGALQDMIRDVEVDQDIVAQLHATLASPAAKQMLDYDTYDIQHVERDLFDNELHALNGDGYPNTSYNVAISNGTFSANYGWESVPRDLCSLQIFVNDVGLPLMSVQAGNTDVGVGDLQTTLTVPHYGYTFPVSFFGFNIATVDLDFTMDINPVFIPTWSALDLQDFDFDPITGDLDPIGWSKFDDYCIQTTALPHQAVSQTSRDAIAGWLTKTSQFILNYSLPGGATTPPDVYQATILRPLTITVQPRTVVVNGTPLNYIFSQWDDGSTANPRTFYASRDVARSVTMKLELAGEWSRDWMTGANDCAPSIAEGIAGTLMVWQDAWRNPWIAVRGECSWDAALLDNPTGVDSYWQRTAVATGPVMSHAAIYHRYTSGAFQLRCKYWASSGYSYANVAIGPSSGGPVSLKIDASGTAHIAYIYNQNLMYASAAPTWGHMSVSTPVVVAAAGPADVVSCSLVLDSQGEPWIAYSSHDGYGPSLSLIHRTAGNWGTPETPDNTHWCYGASLALTADGSPRVSYQGCGKSYPYPCFLWYASKDGPTWTTTQVSSGKVGSSTGLVLDTGGRARIGVKTYDGSSAYTPTVFFEEPGGGWQASACDTATNSAGQVGVAMNGSGYPEMVYTDKEGSHWSAAFATALGGAPDVTSPAAPTVALQHRGTHTLVFTWVAVGDDGTVGVASNYDVRYSTQAINASNFHLATPVAGVQCPGEAGTYQCAGLSGLSQSTKYYIAVRVRDNAGNWSAVSNSPYGVTTYSGPEVQCMEGGELATFSRGDDGTPAGNLQLALQITSAMPAHEPVAMRVTLPSSSDGSLLRVAVYDALGRRVRVLASGTCQAGEQALTWDLNTDAGARVRSGVYFVRMQAGERHVSRTLVVLP